MRGACIEGSLVGRAASELLACTEFGAGGGARAWPRALPRAGFHTRACQPGAARVKFLRTRGVGGKPRLDMPLMSSSKGPRCILGSLDLNLLNQGPTQGLHN